jgi:uncharacterized membrane protein
MVVMAIDHVRVYAGVPAGGPEPALFFTRWITHFCAPGFAFFAGTAIFLYGKKLNDVNKLSRFLLFRGLLLVILEITVIRFFWTFNLDFGHFFLAGVIWMLGWCMVLMALLVRLKPIAAGITGVAIISAQQSFRFVPQWMPSSFQTSFTKFWEFIYPTGAEGTEGIFILYVIVPWIGVMAAGYGFGLIMMMEEKRRRKLCLTIGLSFIALFLVIGSILILKKPAQENEPAFIFRLLNQNKYPASPLFLLMTLGPLIALIPLAEKTKGWLANVLSIFGKVPMFYYLMHILLIHLSALMVNLIRSGQIHQGWYKTAPFFTTQPEGVRWSLPLLYLVFIIDVALLFLACRRYARLKEKNAGNWMRYI